jgi:molybdopterin-guanine dinucleotide biosynthesis protein A
MKPADLSNLSGIVLCGGESRRMGRDKGLLPIGDTCWAIHMAAKLASWKIPVFYSINAGQQANYGTLIPSERLIIDALGIPGPLEGLFSAHEKFPDRDILLLACDMLDLDEPGIGQVIDAYSAGKRDSDKSGDDGSVADFFVYRDQGLTQPFCGIYTACGLAAAYRLFRTGNLRDFSLQALLRGDTTFWVGAPDPKAFRNYNTL